MHEFLSAAWSGFLDYGRHVACAGLICLMLELTFPASRYSLRSRLRAAWFWVAYIAIRVAFFTVFNRLWTEIGVRPLISVDLTSLTTSQWPAVRVVSWIFVPIAISMASEFFYYWFHRLQHTNHFLWRFHEVHHSLREMSAINSNHHWTEEIFRIPFVIIPMSLLFSFNPGYIPTIIFFLFGLQGLYEHSCTRLNLGPLRLLIADNRFHRLHHSIRREHWNRNFGSATIVWDLVFGTARLPKRDEWPDVGLSYVDEPQTLSQFLNMPFRRRSSRPSDSKAAALSATTRIAGNAD